MMTFVTFLIFSAALFAAAYYVWVIPANQSADVLQARMRELRARVNPRRSGGGADLIRREQRGSFAAIGDFVAWVGVLRRLQEMIDQANLKYRAADIFAISIVIALGIYFLQGLLGMELFLLRLLISGLASACAASSWLRTVAGVVWFSRKPAISSVRPASVQVCAI
ncbi:MAG: hypothetical protein JNL62_02500, partial [Bryobacterales bacterium]|nr:hypothetical protein [Bryobacterales bacterium]